ncbi:GIY-YIG nuclease family protein [Burkholderia stagnalis]|nr:GIY-YIG nuclease family protein [Burkholderia stagnalis]RQY02520.1 GIY-YIG nuclease family protein [Burkholderia stagnalis]RQY19923.1 GIY-YIG nuclease family protein [Burkholderia stagnalis]RQY31113.1 GIY-YIG nuclease family protein [Burkholderia stagnalis]
MKRLFEIGFAPVGCWRLRDGTLFLELTDKVDHANVLYAFISGDDVLYVGKTTKTLRGRLASYLKPSESQRTNTRNNGAIRGLLSAGQEVDILALPDLGLHRYGEFKINFAAALEDSIIKTLSPPWNGVRSKSTKDDGDDENQPEFDADDAACDIEAEMSASAPSFQFVLQPTYYKNGFFNVSVENQHLFGPQGAGIDIYCGSEKALVQGRFDRTTNSNGTPRIYGYVPLRDWFQANFEPMQPVTVRVVGPSSIELAVT